MTRYMTTIKSLAEHIDKVARRPVPEHRPEGPVKHDGPHSASFSKEEIHAASLLHAAPGDGSAPERARRMAALQQRMGNARLSRLLDEVGAPDPHTHRSANVPKRK